MRARALGLDGKVIRIKADELLAQALEHEIDHLNGILYIDRLVSPGDLWKIEPVGEHDEVYDGEEDDGEEEQKEQESGEVDGVESEDSSGLENAVAVAQDGGNAAG